MTVDGLIFMLVGITLFTGLFIYSLVKIFQSKNSMDNLEDNE